MEIRNFSHTGVWSGLVQSGLVRCGLVWSGLVWFGVVWSGLVWSGPVWSGLVWSVRSGLVSYTRTASSLYTTLIPLISFQSQKLARYLRLAT